MLQKITQMTFRSIDNLGQTYYNSYIISSAKGVYGGEGNDSFRRTERQGSLRRKRRNIRCAEAVIIRVRKLEFDGGNQNVDSNYRGKLCW